MRIRNFAGNEDGAVTVDFVVLCASVVVLGVLVLNVVTDGTETAAAAIDDQIGSAMGGSGDGGGGTQFTDASTLRGEYTIISSANNVLTMHEADSNTEIYVQYTSTSSGVPGQTIYETSNGDISAFGEFISIQ